MGGSEVRFLFVLCLLLSGCLGYGPSIDRPAPVDRPEQKDTFYAALAVRVRAGDFLDTDAMLAVAGSVSLPHKKDISALRAKFPTKQPLVSNGDRIACAQVVEGL
jgi:hypothetical protein